MYDNYNIMLQTFNKQHKNILKNMDINNDNDKSRFKMKKSKKKMNSSDEFDNIILNLNKVNKSLNTLKNIKLTKKDIENVFIKENDYVNIGKNEEKDNVFKRHNLYNDKESYSTVLIPKTDRAFKPYWENIRRSDDKIDNTQYKYRNNVNN